MIGGEIAKTKFKSLFQPMKSGIDPESNQGLVWKRKNTNCLPLPKKKKNSNAATAIFCDRYRE
jgi:hypothetical protein